VPLLSPDLQKNFCVTGQLHLEHNFNLIDVCAFSYSALANIAACFMVEFHSSGWFSSTSLTRDKQRLIDSSVAIF